MLESISPTLLVSDMRRALSFFEQRLGFHSVFKIDDGEDPDIPYAIVERDRVAIHLRLSAEHAGSSACYVTVTDADRLFAEFQAAGARVTRAIENSSYGMRDFNIADPDGNTLGFGQPGLT